MRALLSALGVLAGVVFMAASGAMNFVFMSGQGRGELEGHILGAVSVAVSLSVALLPFFIAWAFANRRLLSSGLGALVWVIFLGFSLLSALGFASLNRGAVTGSRDAITLRHDGTLKDISEADGRLRALGTVRPQAVIDAAIAGTRQEKAWTSSRSCEDATAAASREFCKGYFELRRELAASVEAARLSRKIDDLKREARRLKEQGAGQDRDPQARLLSIISGMDEERAQRGLIVFVALLVELGAALLPYLALAHYRGGEERKEKPVRRWWRRSAAVEVLAPGEVLLPVQPARRHEPRRLERAEDGALRVLR